MLRIPRPVWINLLGLTFVFQPQFPARGTQTVLLRADVSEPPAVSAVQNYAGRIQVVSIPVVPSPEVTVVVLVDSISAQEVPQLRTELTALYQAAKKSHPLAMALVKDQAFQRVGPFKTLAKLQAALRDLAKQLPESPENFTAQRLDALLAGKMADLGSNWASVLIVGKFDEVSADLRPVVETRLSEQFSTQQLRITYWSPTGERWLPFEETARTTGGMVAPHGLAEYADFLDRQPQSFSRLTWTGPALRQGFHFYRTALLDPAGKVMAVVPSLATAAGAEIPRLELCADLQERANTLKTLSQEPGLTPAQSESLRSGLEQALAINPFDVELLHLGVDLYRRLGQPGKLAALLEDLILLEPDDAQQLAELGHAWFATGNLTKSEPSLKRARELQPGDSRVSEELARISAARQDNKAALAFAQESLAINTRNQDLWFWYASLSTQTMDWERAADALEHGLDLGGVHIPERTALIRIYLEHNNSQKALTHVRAGIPELPPDPATFSTYAEFLEQLGQKKEALNLWQKALEINPKLEPAHYRSVGLLLDLDDPAGAVRAADAGLAAAPDSARIYLSKSYAQEKLGWWYEARRTLQTAAGSLRDPQLLRRYAEVEDTYSLDASRGYQMLIEALEKSPLPPDYLPTLERGLRVALRDHDSGRAQWFAARLEKAGHPEYMSLLDRGAPSDTGAVVPGGMKALLSAIDQKGQVSGERFFARFARTVLNYLSILDNNLAQEYVDGIVDHFKRVVELQTYGKRSSGGFSIMLSTQDDKSRRTTEEVLHLIGWELQTSRKAIKAQGASTGAAAQRRVTATSLDIDEVAMQEALQSGKPFNIEIVEDRVPILFGEEPWRDQFYASKNLPGGFAEALVRNPRMAKVYVGLEALDEEGAMALLREVGLKELSDKYADLLYNYSTAMAVIGSKVTLPGGDKAAPVWEQLVGAKLSPPGLFFRALLKKDDGKMLAFYFNLAQLDPGHQEFFTKSATRTRQYYELFKDSPDVQFGARRPLRETPFIEFIRNLPLDAAGHVEFPGSPEVWMVAEGQSNSTGETARLLRKATRLVAPEVEDQILMRLMRTVYSTAHRQQSELDNFLAVASIERHRTEPLDERSALLLAQQFARYEPAWPYFAVLTGLSANEFEKFFAMGDKVRDYDTVRLNDLMGQLHSLLGLLCLLREGGRISDLQSTQLFAEICDRFAKAGGAAELASASLEITREMLRHALQQVPPDPDGAMAALLLDSPVAPTLEAGDKNRRVDAGRIRLDNYDRVLDLQKVTTLRTLFKLYDAARSLAGGAADPAGEVKMLEEASRGLLTVAIPEPTLDKIKGGVRENLLSFQPGEVADIISRLQRALSKKKVKPQDIQKLSGELLAAISPQVRIALSGILYAYYLNPNDLLVSADPLLLRKHQFVALENDKRAYVPFYQEDMLTGAPEGTSFLGGFAGFSSIAGDVALTSARREDEKIGFFFSAQLGSIRASRWGDLQDEDLRLVGLKVRSAREWIVRAAERPDVFADLADALAGVLSFARRGDLLHALSTRDWSTVWDSITLGDLYFLGDEFLRRYGADSWSSPTIDALRRFASKNDGSRLHTLGPDLHALLYCSHPHLVRLAPYEYYERFFFPQKIAARAAEFKLVLAEYFDRAGMPASRLGPLAEPLSLEIFRSMRLTDQWDWFSVLSAYSKLNDEVVKRVSRVPQ